MYRALAIPFWSILVVIAILRRNANICHGAPVDVQGTRTPPAGQCMREWLTMAEAPNSSLTFLEERIRYYQLSESRIKQEHKAILRVLLPSIIVDNLKTCISDPSVCGGPAPCNTGQCVYNETVNRHGCLCPVGLIGDRCQLDIDECSYAHHGCDVAENVVCTNTHGSYRCRCQDGYGERDGHCEDVNECQSGTHGCHGNATCTNIAGSYVCSCAEGFTGDGFRCEEIYCTEKKLQEQERRLEEQEKRLASTGATVITLSRALGGLYKPDFEMSIGASGEQLTVISRLEKRLEDQEKRLAHQENLLASAETAIIGHATKLSELAGHEHCQGVAAWRYYPWFGWYSDQDSGELKRVTYNKQRNDTILRVVFHSKLRQQGHDGCSLWYVTFAGEECSQPSPIRTSIYTANNDRSVSDISRPGELSGFCNTTASRPSFFQGPIEISVHVRACASSTNNAWTGVYGDNKNDGTLSYLVVEEYCP